MSEKCRRWLAANPEIRRESGRQYAKRHPHKMVEKVALRRAAKYRATPVWCNRFFIREAYHLAMIRTKATGIRWHVDHIVPLRSKLVCGLHAHTNIAVLPARTNQLKGNRTWPDMP